MKKAGFTPVIGWRPNKGFCVEPVLYVDWSGRLLIFLYLLTRPIKPCFSVDVLLCQDKELFSDEQAAYITGSLLEAGSDTTSGTLVGFIQAMLMFPEAQKAAQEEIDRVIGSNRMPEMEDMSNCQYIRSCVKETIRWMPTIIIGSPHGVIQEDHYEGYRIPNGATIVNNNW